MGGFDPSEFCIALVMKAFWIIGSALALLAGLSAQAAEPARKGPAPTPIQSSPSEARSGAEIVGKLLKPGPSDPDIPLPSREPSDGTSGNKKGTGPQIYGREEAGGAVFGLTFPIPVRPGDSRATTRYSSDIDGPQNRLESR